MDRWATFIIPDPAGLAVNQDRRCRFTRSAWVSAKVHREGSSRPSAKIETALIHAAHIYQIVAVRLEELDQITVFHAAFLGW